MKKFLTKRTAILSNVFCEWTFNDYLVAPENIRFTCSEKKLIEFKFLKDTDILAHAIYALSGNKRREIADVANLVPLIAGNYVKRKARVWMSITL